MAIQYNPEAVQRDGGRHVLIDADCVAYWGAAQCDGQAVSTAIRRTDQRMNQILDECQARDYTGFLTGKDNFRDKLATLQRYKGNRYDEDGRRLTPQPEWLQEVRLHLETEWGCLMEQGQEADDALGIAREELLVDEPDTISIISSIDKDLRINPGMHHNQNTGEVDEVTGFGEIHKRKSGIGGSGLKFFYAQMIMGDSADWIKGLPKVTEYMKEEYPGIRRGGAGPMVAYHVLNGVDNQADAEHLVWECYKSYWIENGYKHWKTGEVFLPGLHTARKQFVEQGRLLWMRRKKNEMWEPMLPRTSLI